MKIWPDKAFQHLPLILFSIAVVGCRTHQPRFAGYTPPTAPDVITMELFSVSPRLTREKVKSIHSLLLERQFKDLKELKAALPTGLLLCPVSYTLKGPFDASGRITPYTETVSVCRLSEDRDLVVVEDDRSGRDAIQNWFIRDLPIQK